MSAFEVLIPLGGMAVGALMMVGVYKFAVRWLDFRHQRLGGGGGADSGEMRALRDDVERLMLLQDRVMELEERVDFAERLLAKGPDV